jgi:hypothetical protein
MVPKPRVAVFWCADGCPFDSPLLSNPGFLALLCPLVKKLELCELEFSMLEEEFAAICQLTGLEELTIAGCGESAVCPLSTLVSNGARNLDQTPDI